MAWLRPHLQTYARVQGTSCFRLRCSPYLHPSSSLASSLMCSEAQQGAHQRTKAAPNATQYDYLFKFVLTGDSGVCSASPLHRTMSRAKLMASALFQ